MFLQFSFGEHTRGEQNPEHVDFGNIKSRERWSTNDKMAVSGHKKILKKFKTVFPLKLFSSVFALSDILFHILKHEVWV
jgi:hypothetical protein